MTDATPMTRQQAPAAAVTVRLPGQLRDLTDGKDQVAMPGVRTVSEVLDALLGRYPGLRRHVRADDGSIRDYVNIFLNEDDIRYLDGSGTVVTEGDVITVVPSIAGG